MRQIRALIIGAGMGGCALSLALRKLNEQARRTGVLFSSTIFEQAPVIKPVGAGIALGPNGLSILESLGLYPKLQAFGGEVHSLQVYKDDGQRLRGFDLSFIARKHGYPLLVLERAELQALMIDEILHPTPRVGEKRAEPAIRQEEIVLNKKCVGVEDLGPKCGVRAHFADGTTEEGDVLLAADGLKSVIREQIILQTDLKSTANKGPPPICSAAFPRYSGISCVLGVTESVPESIQGNVYWIFGPGRVYGTWSMGKQKQYWFLAERETFLPAPNANVGGAAGGGGYAGGGGGGAFYSGGGSGFSGGGYGGSDGYSGGGGGGGGRGGYNGGGDGGYGSLDGASTGAGGALSGGGYGGGVRGYSAGGGEGDYSGYGGGGYGSREGGFGGGGYGGGDGGYGGGRVRGYSGGGGGGGGGVYSGDGGGGGGVYIGDGGGGGGVYSGGGGGYGGGECDGYGGAVNNNTSAGGPSWSHDAALKGMDRMWNWFHPYDHHAMFNRTTRMVKIGMFEAPWKGPWGRGNVALVGDAAHAMLPTLNQGANMAIEDACAVARALAHQPTDVSAALGRYQELRKKRVGRLMCLARMLGALQTTNSDLVSRMNETAVKFAPQSIFERSMDWVMRYRDPLR
ncbi:hypothetical protein CBR_g38560 [Chara braunii]|uniref:FAD-binding domain-containing protein n=1 Tax=Chara braunii TaxID=69332 RepID=A0A388K0C6_CHABU|nr:hypothetical protein CBR_g38560 [Chara braunii]|eukprot:GBG63492.1 hypothetical protein CBR_g38560 [Chara braunii]